MILESSAAVFWSGTAHRIVFGDVVVQILRQQCVAWSRSSPSMNRLIRGSVARFANSDLDCFKEFSHSLGAKTGSREDRATKRAVNGLDVVAAPRMKRREPN